MPALTLLLGLACCAMTMSALTGPTLAQSARAGDGWPIHWRWSNFRQACAGDCALAIYAGRVVHTDMTDIFGVDDFTAPWDWQYGDAGLIAGTMSRRFMSIGTWVDFEIEAGVGQRFGSMHETEFWGAIYARWVAFPWNHWLRTTIAVSSGLNWATGISDLERQRSGNHEGSRLLHFLSPEITFALPSRPDVELLFRFHHRSGGKDIVGPVAIFNNVNGAAHYATVGIRWRY